MSKQKMDRSRTKAGSGVDGDRDLCGTSHRRGGYRLQLVFTPESRERLDQLKDTIEADSYGEVVRRALIALETFDPIDPPLAAGNVVPFKAPSPHEPKSCTERVQAVLPERSYRRLLELRKVLKKGEQDASTAEVVRQALRVLTQLVRNWEKLGEGSGKPPQDLSTVFVRKGLVLAV